MRGRVGAKPGLLTGAPAAVMAALASRPLFAMLFAALSALFPVSACAFSPIGGLALGAGLEAGAAVSGSPYWPSKAQSRLAMRLMLENRLGGIWGLGFSLGYHWSDESNAAAGFLYRGHNGAEAAAYLLLRPPLDADRLTARWGMAVGASANFDVYNRTELLFFYPSLTVEPYVELPTEGPPRHTFSFGFPFRVDFRRDLSSSVCFGLELCWRWYPRWKKEGT